MDIKSLHKGGGGAPQVNADWNATEGVAEILNKPTIPEPIEQVNSDWNATEGVEVILNKPTIPDAQVQSDWNQETDTEPDFIKNKPAVGGAFSGCRATSSAAIAISNNNQTALSFDVDVYDTDNYHNPASNNSRFYAPSDGYYLLTFNGRWSGDVGGINQHHIRKNGDANQYLATYVGPLGTTSIPPMAAVFYLTAGDYVEILSRHITGSTLYINRNYEYEPIICITKL